jgi:hypothetical protein
MKFLIVFILKSILVIIALIIITSYPFLIPLRFLYDFKFLTYEMYINDRNPLETIKFALSLYE